MSEYNESSIPNNNDPLEGYGDNIEEKYYVLDSTVFAEPIKHIVPVEKCEHNRRRDKNYTFIDKVIVEERDGKRNKKYHIPIKKSITKCPQQSCGKSFDSITLLRAHVRKVHCAVRQFVCELCGADFTAKYLLKRHSLVHGKRTECPVCKKSLSGRTNMSVHLRSHADTRTHQCEVCSKRFLRSSTLKRHRQLLHEYVDSCDACHERFPSRSSAKSHVCQPETVQLG